MPDPFHGDDDAGGTLFRDVLSLALMGFLAVIVLLLPYINPRGTEAEANTPPPGNVIVEITWAAELNADQLVRKWLGSDIPAMPPVRPLCP